jgi:hypothetical protein
LVREKLNVAMREGNFIRNDLADLVEYSRRAKKMNFRSMVDKVVNTNIPEFSILTKKI